ncbi:MAG: hypothetical protein ABIE23_06560 [archaeon]
MAYVMIHGETTDINFDPKQLQRWKRDKVGRDYFKMKSTELFRWIVFWIILAGFAFFALLSFAETAFMIPAIILFFAMVKAHFWYLKAWSKWNKFARKSVVRMDLPKEDRVIVPPKMPWVPLKGVRKGL